MSLNAQPRSPVGRLAALVVAAVVGAAIAGLSGGLAGPAAALCLAPLAMALWSRASLAAGSALSLASAAALGLAALAGSLPPVPLDPLATLLGAATLTVIAAAFGGGLVRRLGRVDEDAGLPARLERLLGDQPGLLLLLESDGAVRAAYGEAPPGVDPQGLLGHALPDGVPPAARPVLLAALVEARRDGAAEVLLFTGPVTAARLRLRKSRDDRLVGWLVDAGAERRRMRQLEDARADAERQNLAKSAFLAGMSHELRTPLNAIMGFSDIMRARLFGPLPDRYRDYAQLIHESGAHLLDLINDVLDVSKIEAAKYTLQVEPGDAREPVQAALRLMRTQAEEAGIALRSLIADAPIPATLDKRAVKQITLNLLSNALKFTPRGGEVTLSLEPVDDTLELTVADTGVGVSPEDLERLGRPYEQAAAGKNATGTGLGLSLVRSLAELHGGALTIESALGAGTAVTVRLPVLAAPETAAPDNVIPFARGL